MGIGQGYLSVNALQLCVQAARIANGVTALTPRLVHSIGDVIQPSGAQAPPLGVDSTHLQFVRDAMAAVVTSGTAAVNKVTQTWSFSSVQMAGKTGTAQSRSYAGGRGAHGSVGAWSQRDHAWFIAYAPADDPRYAMSVLVEHGGFGADAAAPKAREIMRVALLKDPQIRARIVQPTSGPQDASSPPTDHCRRTAAETPDPHCRPMTDPRRDRALNHAPGRAGSIHREIGRDRLAVLLRDHRHHWSRRADALFDRG